MGKDRNISVFVGVCRLANVRLNNTILWCIYICNLCKHPVFTLCESSDAMGVLWLF